MRTVTILTQQRSDTMDDDTQIPDDSPEAEPEVSPSWYTSPLLLGQLIVTILMVASIIFLCVSDGNYTDAGLVMLWILFLGFVQFVLMIRCQNKLESNIHRKISLSIGAFSTVVAIIVLVLLTFLLVIFLLIAFTWLAMPT